MKNNLFLKQFILPVLFAALALSSIISCSKKEIAGIPLQGWVYFAGTNIPVTGAKVEVGAVSTTTGSDGKFSLTADEGNQQIQVAKEGFDTYIDNFSVPSTALIIEMTSSSFTSLLSGVVKSDKGNLLSNITVVVLNNDGTDSNLKTTTDGNGNYQLNAVPQGRRTVKFMAQSSFDYDLYRAVIFINSRDYRYSVNLIQLFDSVTYQGVTYKTHKIGNQWWMTENLKATNYRNGDPITFVTEAGTWSSLTTEAFCYYNNDIANKDIYGVYFNWFAVIDSRNIAPVGWHVPTDGDWNIFTNYFQSYSSSEVIQKYKEMFTPVAGGFRSKTGDFALCGAITYYWSSAEYDVSYARYYEGGNATNANNKRMGLPVRCVRD